MIGISRALEVEGLKRGKGGVKKYTCLHEYHLWMIGISRALEVEGVKQGKGGVKK